jgi:hypothetical protein
VLLLWAHPLVIVHAFDTRYYTPLLAATVWFYFFLKRLGQTRHRWPIAIGVAICSIIICTLHYFGIITLALITLGHFRLDPRGRKQSWRDLIPVAAGPIALVAFAAYFLPKQRAALSATWIAPMYDDQVREFFDDLFPYKLLLLTLGAAVLAMVPGWLLKRVPSFRVLSHFGGLIALALVPIVMILFSEFVQPSLISRYAITTVLVLPVLVAFAFAHARPTMVTPIVCAAIVTMGGVAMYLHAQRWAGPSGYSANLDRLVESLRTRTDEGAPIFFEFRQHLYPVAHIAPDLAPRCGYWDFDRQHSAYRTCERDVARAMHRFNRPPVLWHENLLPWLPKAYLVTVTQPDTVQRIEQELPGFTVRKLAKDLYEIVRLP